LNHRITRLLEEVGQLCERRVSDWNQEEDIINGVEGPKPKPVLISIPNNKRKA